jgi:hypothetical protein
MEAASNYSLKRHAVRILRSDLTIGSGFLIAPPDSRNAFVLTAAHVLHGDNKNLNIQFLEVSQPHERSRSIPSDACFLHSGYDHSKARTMIQYCDAALIRIERETWMKDLPPVYWGVPRDKMDIIAVGFATVNLDPSPAHGSVFHDTRIRLFTPEDHRISAPIRGEFILNHADLDSEMEGMCGTYFSAKGQDAIILVGMMVASTGANAALGQMNLIDTAGIMELLKAHGVHMERRSVRTAATSSASHAQTAPSYPPPAAGNTYNMGSVGNFLANGNQIQNYYILGGSGLPGAPAMPNLGISPCMDTGYYNLFVVPQDAHIPGGFRIPKEHILEDTAPDIYNDLCALGNREISRIKSYPAVVAAPNAQYGKTEGCSAALLGFLNSIQVCEDSVLFGFSNLLSIPLGHLIDNSDVFQIGKASAFNEFDRQHLAVKRVNIVAELHKRGIAVPFFQQ